MSDLIDLNSPDTHKVLRKELASPLIPPPAGSGRDEPSPITNSLPNLMTGEKRNSLDNNPFDQVFKETAEYVRKKEDPFEMVLEKVTSSKKSKRHSVEFKDDFIPKHTRHAEVLKMNKTLDDSVIDIDLNVSRSCLRECSIIEDLNNTDLLNENNKDENVPRISIQTASPVNTSILNYSAMNDSLTESNVSAKETAIRSLVAQRVSLCIQKGIMEAEGMLNSNQHLKLINCRRSLSQSDRLSPKKFEFRQRSHSIMDTKRKSSRSERSTLSSMPSIEFDDQMNKAFLNEQYSADNSVFSDLSNISEITRLASVSSAYNSSISLFSNGTMNQAFIRSGSSSSRYLPAITISPANTCKSFRSNSTSTIGSMSASESVRSDISDLREKFKALKTKLSQNFLSNSGAKGDISELSEKFKELKYSINGDEAKENLIRESKSEVESERGKEDKKEERLIDVDVFLPLNESKSSRSKSSFSNSSSDSVFSKSGADKSILSEARKLAKTFEEMADDKSSSASGDDLLSSHTRFDFDELPCSDDEVIVDNLIDLPPSPSISGVPPNSPMEVKCSPPNEYQKEKNTTKEIEMEFIQPKDPEKKIMATSLLLELDKLIKTEKNPDAEKLLNELEKVLGVKWENNTELLETYLQNAKSNVHIDKDDSWNKNVENKNSENEDVGNKGNSKSIEDREVKENESIESNKEDEKEDLKRKNAIVLKKGKPEIRKIQYQSGLTKSISRSLDSASKVNAFSEKSFHDDLAMNQMSIRNNSQSSKEKLKSQILGIRKRFSSDSNALNPTSEKKPVDFTTLSMKKSVSSKEIREKVIPVPDVPKNTISNVANAVRNKLKHKSETGVSKKGPMKAIIPFGNMQRRDSFGKKIVPVTEPKTPPKTLPEVPSVFTATSSTPNSSITSVLFKKSKSKPVASSTPDHKESRTPILKPPSPRKRNFSCNISPVPVLSKSSQEKLGLKESPKESKINASSLKRPSTPKAQRLPRVPSGIPKYSPRLEMQRRRSLNDLNKLARRSESPQSVSAASSLRKTPISAKKIENEPPNSPLRSVNKKDLKVKPFNLISKLRRRGNNYTEAEKENYL